MGVYQNHPVKRVDVKGCPRCGEAPAPEGVFFCTRVSVPLRVRLFVFRINLQVRVGIKYCPRCGYLRVELCQ